MSEREPSGLPRWAILAGIALLIVVLLVVVVIMAGGHTPRRHGPPQDASTPQVTATQPHLPPKGGHR